MCRTNGIVKYIITLLFTIHNLGGFKKSASPKLKRLLDVLDSICVWKKLQISKMYNF